MNTHPPTKVIYLTIGAVIGAIALHFLPPSHANAAADGPAEQYKVVFIDVGNVQAIPASAERALNQHAQQGWKLRASDMNGQVLILVK